MKRIHRTCRFVSVLAGLVTTLLALGAAAPAARATIPDPGGAPGVQLATQAIVTGGMPGWQITLIAAGAALVAAVLTVLADRARAARRHMAVPGA
jgi:hypothetical protein